MAGNGKNERRVIHVGTATMEMPVRVCRVNHPGLSRLMIGTILFKFMPQVVDDIAIIVITRLHKKDVRTRQAKCVNVKSLGIDDGNIAYAQWVIFDGHLKRHGFADVIEPADADIQRPIAANPGGVVGDVVLHFLFGYLHGPGNHRERAAWDGKRI